MPPHRAQCGLDVGGIVVEVRADPDIAVTGGDNDAVFAHGGDKCLLVSRCHGDHRAVLRCPARSHDGAAKIGNARPKLIV